MIICEQKNDFQFFFDAVNIVSILFIMVKEVLTNWRTIAYAVISLLLTFGFRKGSFVVIILVGALTGYLLTLV